MGEIVGSSSESVKGQIGIGVKKLNNPPSCFTHNVNYTFSQCLT